MTEIAADIGGTHARFALTDGDALRHPMKLAAADHADLPAALRAYCALHGAEPAGGLRLATAARRHEDGVWRFTNRNRWEIDARALEASGWRIERIANDFAASARGALSLDAADLVTIQQGATSPGAAANSHPRAILGPGTGLGMAYALPETNGGWRVQETFGGHMLAAALTEEQAEIMRLLRGILGTEVVVPEDLASGRALPHLYQAAALFNNRAPRHHDDLLAAAEEPDVAQALRLLHEFLGIFAQGVVVTTHAFGGLYLDGGLVQRLHQDGVFDAGAFLRGFVPPLVPVVRDALRAMPVWLVTDPFVALRGLLAMEPA